ncbi:hypothetical protein EDC01DRAFT_756099, partial [Geopyxis carbonaria]
KSTSTPPNPSPHLRNKNVLHLHNPRFRTSSPPHRLQANAFLHSPPPPQTPTCTMTVRPPTALRPPSYPLSSPSDDPTPCVHCGRPGCTTCARRLDYENDAFSTLTHDAPHPGSTFRSDAQPCNPSPEKPASKCCPDCAVPCRCGFLIPGCDTVPCSCDRPGMPYIITTPEGVFEPGFVPGCKGGGGEPRGGIERTRAPPVRDGLSPSCEDAAMGHGRSEVGTTRNRRRWLRIPSRVPSRLI